MLDPAAVSRDAQIIAWSLFRNANRSEASFAKNARIHPRTMAAMEELHALGLVKLTKYKGGSVTCYGHRDLRDWLPEWRKPTEAESFPITEAK